MAHIKTQNKSKTQNLEKKQLATVRSSELESPDTSLFYELEAAIVIDVIRDETHPIFSPSNPEVPMVEGSTWPASKPDNGGKTYNDSTTPDFSWIGRVRVRMINSQQTTPVDKLDWVTPLETGVFEYPLVNEIVVVSQYMGRLYYNRRLNVRNFINNCADFAYEHRYGGPGGISAVKSPGSLEGARNTSDLWPASNRYADPPGKTFLGKYFKVNNKIRPLKHFEGDTIIQSRMGSSIRFGGYENNPTVDVGTALGYGESYADNLGNPMILIRNRQKKTKNPEDLFQFNILENINEDGSSIHITSGRTVSKFVPTITHKYDNVPYRRRGCVHKSFHGLETLRKSKVGIGSDYIRRDTATRFARPPGSRIN